MPTPAAAAAGAPSWLSLAAAGNFECPFSSRHATTMKALREHYGDKVRFVWRDQPLAFHTHAHLSAQAAREALAQKGSEGFWRFHDALFQSQRALTRPDLERYAKEQGLELKRFRRALDQRTHAAAVDADIAVAGQVGARGTPTSFINGRSLLGSQPLEKFKQVIDAALAAP